MASGGPGNIVKAIAGKLDGAAAGAQKVRSLEEAVNAVLARYHVLSPSVLEKLTKDLTALFDDFVAHNARRLHLNGKPSPLEELNDLKKAGGLEPLPKPSEDPKSRQPSKSELRLIEDKARYKKLLDLSDDKSLPESVRRDLKLIIEEYFGKAGLADSIKTKLSFFFSSYPSSLLDKPELLATFKKVREAKAQMWSALREAGIARPQFLETAGVQTAQRAAKRAKLVVEASATAADRARADFLWKRISQSLEKTPQGALPNANTMQDMVDMIDLAARQPNGMEAVRGEIRNALREQFGAMRQRWLDDIMSAEQSKLRSAIEDMGFKFKTDADPKWARRIYFEMANAQTVKRIGLDLDHANIGFAGARDQFIEEFLTNKRISTDALRPIFDPANLQPMTPLENSAVIGVLRQQLKDLEGGVAMGRTLSSSPADLLKAGSARAEQMGQVRRELDAIQQDAANYAKLRGEVLDVRKKIAMLKDGREKEELIRRFEEPNLFFTDPTGSK